MTRPGTDVQPLGPTDGGAPEPGGEGLTPLPAPAVSPEPTGANLDDADADRLAGYVVALTTAATSAAITFLVLSGQTGVGERFKQSRVLLTSLPAGSRFTGTGAEPEGAR